MKFSYISKSKCLKVKTIDDIEDFNLVCDSLKEMAFSEDEQDCVWSIISAVLNLGNVKFDDSDYDITKNQYVKVKNMDQLEKVA